MNVLGQVAIVLVTYPIFGFFAVLIFTFFSWCAISFFNFLNIRPTHYKYIDYEQLCKYSKKDHLKEFIEGNIDKNLEKIQDKLPPNYKDIPYFKSGCERMCVYIDLVKKNKIKNLIKLYFVLMFFGAVFFHLYQAIDAFVLNYFPDSILVSIDEEGDKGLSSICMLIIFGLLTIFYYFLDFIYSLTLPSILTNYIEEKNRDEKKD